MAKGDFYFPLYYQRLLVSTTGWKDEEFGAYVRLLIFQFANNNSIPNDLNELVLIAPSVKKHWKRLSKKFKENSDGNLHNDVMAEVYNEVQTIKQKNTDNGKKGGRPKKPNGYENNNQNKTGGFVLANPNLTYIEDRIKNIEYKEEENTKRILPENEGNNENLYLDKSLHHIDLMPDEMDLTISYLEGVCYNEFKDESVKNQWLNRFEIERQWKSFKIMFFNGEKPYKTWGDVIGHFRDWLKNGIRKTSKKPGFYQPENSGEPSNTKLVLEARKKEDALNGNH